MKNAWLDELSVKRAVRHINSKLRDKFVGKPDDDMTKFFDLIVASLASYNTRIRDTIGLRYNLETVMANGVVSDIKLVKLPWLV